MYTRKGGLEKLPSLFGTKNMISMLEKIKRAINWMNYHIGGLRGEDAFFKTGDPLENEIVANMFE